MKITYAIGGVVALATLTAGTFTAASWTRTLPEQTARPAVAEIGDPAGTGAPGWMRDAGEGDHPTKAELEIHMAYEVGTQEGWVWLPVETEFADALAEGGDVGATTQAWETCVYSPLVIVCPDGQVTDL